MPVLKATSMQAFKWGRAESSSLRYSSKVKTLFLTLAPLLSLRLTLENAFKGRPLNKAFAREMLGPKRFNLVESGKLRVDNLYYHGKLITIKELKDLMK